MIKWGIIGCGGIARRRVAPAATEMKLTRFTAVMDVDRQATDEVAESLRAKAYYTVADLLADSEIRAVYVATPVHVHAEQAIAAARAGKHVLVEKPLALTVEQAEQQLGHFAERWDERYPTISALWRRHWSQVIPFFAFPEEIRKVIYTANAVESLNMSLRKAIKTRGAFPSEEAALKVIYLALRNVIAKWETVQHWKSALNRFTLLWDDRIQAVGRR